MISRRAGESESRGRRTPSVSDSPTLRLIILDRLSLPVDNGDFDAMTVGVSLQATTSRKLFARTLLQYDHAPFREEALNDRLGVAKLTYLVRL